MLAAVHLEVDHLAVDHLAQVDRTAGRTDSKPRRSLAAAAAVEDAAVVVLAVAES